MKLPLSLTGQHVIHNVETLCPVPPQQFKRSFTLRGFSHTRPNSFPCNPTPTATRVRWHCHKIRAAGVCVAGGGKDKYKTRAVISRRPFPSGALTRVAPRTAEPRRPRYRAAPAAPHRVGHPGPVRIPPVRPTAGSPAHTCTAGKAPFSR